MYQTYRMLMSSFGDRITRTHIGNMSRGGSMTSHTDIPGGCWASERRTLHREKIARNNTDCGCSTTNDEDFQCTPDGGDFDDLPLSVAENE